MKYNSSQKSLIKSLLANLNSNWQVIFDYNHHVSGLRISKNLSQSINWLSTDRILQYSAHWPWENSNYRGSYIRELHKSVLIVTKHFGNNRRPQTFQKDGWLRSSDPSIAEPAEELIAEVQVRVETRQLPPASSSGGSGGKLVVGVFCWGNFEFLVRQDEDGQRGGEEATSSGCPWRGCRQRLANAFRAVEGIDLFQCSMLC